MSDPTRLPEDEQAKATLHAQTEEINRLERLLSEHGQTAQAITEVDEPAPPEKLFSRRTLFGWAFATLLIVFIIRMVLPVVFETVKDTVVTSMKESIGNTAVTPVVAPAPPTTVIPAPAPAPATPEVPGKPGTVAPVTTTSTTIVKIDVKKR
jgi:hypothetical protein